MALSLESIQHGVSEAPPRFIVYGVAGVGKTTMLSQAPSPIMIQTEDGEGVIDMPRFPLAKSYDDVMDALGILATTNHNYLTVGIDSLDWLEPMVWDKVVQDNPLVSAKSGRTATNIEAYDFQKGYKMAMDYWREYVDAINYLRNEKGMMIIQIAHSAIQTFDSPESGSYDRYNIKLHTNKKGEGASAYLQQHSDCVFFINYKTHVTEEKGKFNVVKTRAVGKGDRTMFTQERPMHSAKTRYPLPYEIPFDKDGNYWGTLADHIPYLRSYVEHLVSTAPTQPEAEQNQTQPNQAEGA